MQYYYPMTTGQFLDMTKEQLIRRVQELEGSAGLTPYYIAGGTAAGLLVGWLIFRRRR